MRESVVESMQESSCISRFDGAVKAHRLLSYQGPDMATSQGTDIDGRFEDKWCDQGFTGWWCCSGPCVLLCGVESLQSRVNDVGGPIHLPEVGSLASSRKCKVLYLFRPTGGIRHQE